jgi:hypothetical protein
MAGWLASELEPKVDPTPFKHGTLIFFSILFRKAIGFEN